MKTRIVMMLLLLSPLVAEEIKPLTHEEIENFRASQVDLMRAQSQVDKAVAQYQAIAGQYDATFKAIFEARKLKQEEATLCDGPGQTGACVGVAPKKLVLVANPKPEPKPAEVKK